MFVNKTILSIALASLLFSGCANDPYYRSKVGVGLGAVLGGVAGHQVNGKNGKYVGAVAGAIAGGLIGRYMDKQQQEVEAALQNEIAANQVEVTRLPDNSIRVNISSQVSFPVGSAAISPSFQSPLDQVANSFRTNDKTVIHVVGHTDDTGSNEYNQDLSERRASSVGNYLASRGVLSSRILASGFGETKPRASNATASGKAANRRVDIYIKPIVEGNEQAAYQLNI